MNKILIINSEPFQDLTATGITLKNIFGIIPLSSLSYIHVSKLQPDLEFYNNVFSYYKDSVETNNHLNAVVTRKGQVKQDGKIKAIIKNELRTWDDLRKVKFSDNIKRYIVDSEAQVIYTCLGSLRIISLVLFAQKLLKCKVVPHFMDDWKSVIFSKKRFIIHNFILQRQLKELFRNVSEGIAISEAMSNQYQQEFKIPFYFIMNSIPDERISNLPEKTKYSLQKFIFTGGLHLNRWQSLLILCEAFNHISLFNELIIEIYCPESDKQRYLSHFDKYKFVKFKGHLPFNEVNKVLQSADVLIHCESFDTYIRKYTRLSISTKIPLYMKEAKLILALGPEEIESMQYIKRNKAGITISENEPLLIAQKIKTLILDNLEINDLIINAVNLTKKNHSYSSVKQKLYKIFYNEQIK